MRLGQRESRFILMMTLDACVLRWREVHHDFVLRFPPFWELNLFITTGNPFWGTKLLGFSIGRGSGALKGVNKHSARN